MNTTLTDTFAAASQFHAAGHLPQAEQKYWEVLERDADHAGAWHRLGLIALQQGDTPRAVDFLRRAATGRGGGAVQWNDLGVVHGMAGHLAEAGAAFEEALRLEPNYAGAHDNLGVVLQRRGDLDRAVGCHREAIRCQPDFAQAYHNLGTAFTALGRRDEAVAALEEALRLAPEFVEAANSLGIALHERGDVGRAMDCYRRALRLQPHHANAANNLATALKEQGLLAEAVTQYRETLRLQPDHALAWYHLSQFAGEGRYVFAADEIERLKGYVAAGRAPELDRSLYCFALGGVFDAQGAIDEAFAYFRQGNDLRRQLFRERHLAFDPEQHREFVDRVLATFDREYFQRVQGWGVATEVPVFVVGMPRSGSTLVEQIVASHPEARGAGELGVVPRMMDHLARQAAGTGRDPLLLPDRAAAQALAAEYLQPLTQVGAGAARVTDKTLENVPFLGVLATLFPNARVIHCRRDPRDVGLSCYFQNFQNLNFTWSLEDIAAYYHECERLMAHWRRVLPLPIHEVTYEDLVRRQEATSRDLVAFCGLSWDEHCLAFHQNRRVVRTASTLQVRKPVSPRSIGRWQRYRAHLGPLLQALGLPAGEPEARTRGGTDSCACASGWPSEPIPPTPRPS
jgi:tetratricopeptide (TPR) repeat protein